MGTRREGFPVYEHYGENYTDLLPQEFTRDDVRALRIAQGMKPDPKMAISNWVKRGLVVRDESRGLYSKVVSSQLKYALYALAFGLPSRGNL